MVKRFNFKLPSLPRKKSELNGRLRLAVGLLAVCNVVATYLCLNPPGGTRGQITAEVAQLNNQLAVARHQSSHLRTVSQNVQLGRKQAFDFQAAAVLPKRTAYGRVISELQGMSKSAGLQIRDAVFADEPIEGTSDLSLLSVTANYQGTYDNLMQFLHEADHSSILLMLDNLQAAQQDKGDQINVAIRFQTVIRDVPAAGLEAAQ